MRGRKNRGHFVQGHSPKDILDSILFFLEKQISIPSLNLNQTWRQFATTVAGGHRYGNRSNQLDHPWGIFIADDQTIFFADTFNHRIVELKNNSNNLQIVAGENGQGNRNDQLKYSLNVIIDQQNDTLIICDQGNRRVVRGPRRNDRIGEVIILNIDCYDLIMDNDGYLYVSDEKKHEIRRWKNHMMGNLILQQKYFDKNKIIL